jgi:methionyl-tRNA formyltransferase
VPRIDLEIDPSQTPGMDQTLPVAGPRLRVVVCTHGGLNGALVLSRLLAAPTLEVAALVISSRARGAHESYGRAALGYVRASGVAYALYLWGATALADLLLRGTSEGPVARIALARGIPLLATPRVNDATARAFIAGAAPDLIVSAFFNQHIDAEVAALARVAAVNIHPSPLPHFRGVDPVFFARLRGAARHGVSVHRIEPGFDTGALLAQETDLEAPGSVFAATAALYDRGAALLAGRAATLAADPRGTPQPPGGSYDSWPTRAQVAAFRRSGGRLLRARDLWRLARRGPAAFVIESAR